MHGIVDVTYEEPSKAPPNTVVRGEVYLDQPVYMPAKHGIRLSNIAPDGKGADFEITGRTEDIFSHFPLVHPIKLPDHEGLIVSKAKWRRPVIVVSDMVGSELNAGPGVAKATDTFLCAPIYGCDQFDRSLVERVRAYEFPNLFYLPACKKPFFDEGFIRLDHLQAIRRQDLRDRKCKLTGDAIEFFDEALSLFTTGRLPADSLIELYQAAVPAYE